MNPRLFSEKIIFLHSLGRVLNVLKAKQTRKTKKPVHDLTQGLEQGTCIKALDFNIIMTLYYRSQDKLLCFWDVLNTCRGTKNDIYNHFCWR